MRNKLLVLACVLSILFSMVACGNAENDIAQETETSSVVVSEENSSTSTTVSESTETSDEEFEFYIIDYLTEAEVVETIFSVSKEGRPCVTVKHSDGTTQYHELYEEQGEILWHADVRGENAGIWGGDYKIPGDETSTSSKVPTSESTETSATTPEPAPTEAPEHKHDYTATITKEANCFGAGIKRYSCACGHFYEEEYKDFRNHVGNEHISFNMEPTCTENGVINYVCESCGCVSRIEEPPELGHIPWDYWHYYPEQGYYSRGCKRCGRSVEKTTIKPEGVEIQEIIGIPSDQIGNLH